MINTEIQMTIQRSSSCAINYCEPVGWISLVVLLLLVSVDQLVAVLFNRVSVQIMIMIMVQIIIVGGSRIFFPVASVSSFWPPIVNPHRASQLRVLMISVKIIRTVAWSPVVGESVIKPIIVVHMVLPRVPASGGLGELLSHHR